MPSVSKSQLISTLNELLDICESRITHNLSLAEQIDRATDEEFIEYYNSTSTVPLVVDKFFRGIKAKQTALARGEAADFRAYKVRIMQLLKDIDETYDDSTYIDGFLLLIFQINSKFEAVIADENMRARLDQVIGRKKLQASKKEVKQAERFRTENFSTVVMREMMNIISSYLEQDKFAEMTLEFFEIQKHVTSQQTGGQFVFTADFVRAKFERLVYSLVDRKGTQDELLKRVVALLPSADESQAEFRPKFLAIMAGISGAARLYEKTLQKPYPKIIIASRENRATGTVDHIFKIIDGRPVAVPAEAEIVDVYSLLSYKFLLEKSISELKLFQGSLEKFKEKSKEKSKQQAASALRSGLTVVPEAAASAPMAAASSSTAAASVACTDASGAGALAPAEVAADVASAPMAAASSSTATAHAVSTGAGVTAASTAASSLTATAPAPVASTGAGGASSARLRAPVLPQYAAAASASLSAEMRSNIRPRVALSRDVITTRRDEITSFLDRTSINYADLDTFVKRIGGTIVPAKGSHFKVKFQDRLASFITICGGAKPHKGHDGGIRGIALRNIQDAIRGLLPADLGLSSALSGAASGAGASAAL